MKAESKLTQAERAVAEALNFHDAHEAIDWYRECGAWNLWQLAVRQQERIQHYGEHDRGCTRVENSVDADCDCGFLKAKRMAEEGL